MIKFLTIQVLLLGLSIQLTAQQQYSLDACYRMALERNISIKKADNDITANRIDRKTARFNLLPSASYTLGHYYSFGRNIDPVTNDFINERFSGGFTNVGLQVNLFSGFSSLNAIKQSAYKIEASAYARKEAELELLTNVTMIYARLLSGKEQIEVGKSNIQSTTQQLEIINEKIKVGRLSKYEFYTFNARLNSEQADLVTLQNSYSTDLQRLKQLLNFPYNDAFDIIPVDSNELKVIHVADISAVDLIKSVLERHPMIRQAQLNEQAAKSAVKIAKSGFMPSLSVSGNVASNYNASQTNSRGGKIPISEQLDINRGEYINLRLRIPIFSQMQHSNAVKKEKINVANASLSIQEAENTVVTNILQLTNDFNSAKQRYTATLAAVEQNNLSYDMHREKYNLGQISSVELLAAKDILNASVTKFIQAKLELFFQHQLLMLVKRFSDDRQ